MCISLSFSTTDNIQIRHFLISARNPFIERVAGVGRREEGVAHRSRGEQPRGRAAGAAAAAHRDAADAQARVGHAGAPRPERVQRGP